MPGPHRRRYWPQNFLPVFIQIVSRGRRGVFLELGAGEVGEGAGLGQQLLVEDAAEGEHGEAAVLDLLELQARRLAPRDNRPSGFLHRPLAKWQRKASTLPPRHSLPPSRSPSRKHRQDTQPSPSPLAGGGEGKGKGGAFEHLEDLEVGRGLGEAERVEAELAGLAAVLKHVDGGDLALVGEHLDEADGQSDLAERLGRDLRAPARVRSAHPFRLR